MIRRLIFASLTALMLAGCAEQAGEISRDAEPFDGIAEDANISLLGTEPFWGFDIEPDGDGYIARYSSPENIEGTAFAVARFAGNNGVGFNGELEGLPVQISLTPGDCSDAMSDRSYPYFATIGWGDTTLRGCGFTSDEPFTGDEGP